MKSHTNALIARLAAITGLTISDLKARLLKPQLPALSELLAFLEAAAYPPGTEQHEEGKALLAGFSSFNPEAVMQGIKRIAPDYETLEENLMRSIGASLTAKAMETMQMIDKLDGEMDGLITKFCRVAKVTKEDYVLRTMYKSTHYMDELLEFAEAYPEGSEKHAEVAKLLSNYDGGSYIYEEMKKIDPGFQSPEEWMMSLDDSFLDSLAAAIPQTSLKAAPQ